MRVVIINKSDSTGGAAVVSRRLMESLRGEGVDARMLVVEKLTHSPYIELAASPRSIKRPFLAERLKIFMANGFDRSTLFKIDTGSDGLPLWEHHLVKEADAVLINWVNQGMLSLKGVEKIIALGKPVIWTMHDMWCATGLCHHAGECTRFRDACGRCPLIERPARSLDLSRRRHERKADAYSRAGITFVAVSTWLAARCRESSLLRDARLEVIPNAFPVDEFSLIPALGRAELGLPDDGRHIVLMAAARLDAPVKGLHVAVDALNRLAASGYSEKVLPVFAGELRHADALSGLAMPFVHTGPVDDPVRLRSLFAHAKVVLSTSLYETLPGTLIEGQAAGAWPVSFGRGGQCDIIEHLRSGYIARWLDADDIACGVAHAVDGDHDRASLRESVEARFAAPAVARRYMELFSKILSQKQP